MEGVVFRVRTVVGEVKGREAKGKGGEGVVHGAFELAWFGRQIDGVVMS